MNRRTRGLILLAVSAVAFAGMVILVYTGVTSLRRARDLRFGLEDLDHVLRDNRYSEAEAMMPWLAERSPSASGALSVLRRSLQVAEVTARWEPLNATAQIAVDRFPGNQTIRSVAVYAAYRVGDSARALEWATRHLQNERYANLYGLTLLAANVRFAAEEADKEQLPVALRITNLQDGGTPEEILSAWRLTRDWRYAVDAAALLMSEGRGAEAEEAVIGSSLPLYAPLFAYEVLSDRGEYSDALLAITRAASMNSPAADPRSLELPRAEILLRTADALVRLGRFDEARDVYADVVAEGGAPRRALDVAFANLAWLADTPEEGRAILTRAIDNGSSSWSVFEQLALLYAIDDPGQSGAIISAALEMFGGDARQRLLALRLEEDPDRRGYAAAIWSLLNDVTGDAAANQVQRFALWYFYTRGLVDDLTVLLERPTASSSWQNFYRGLLLSAEGKWSEAADQFALADSVLPSWHTAYNAGIASLRAGKVAQGEALLFEAERRASLSAYPQRSEVVLLAMARIADDSVTALEWVEKALLINPTSAAALRLRSVVSP